MKKKKKKFVKNYNGNIMTVTLNETDAQRTFI